jgi:glutathione synthase/RimK-type ligase-like ATP-grasp enzyme
VRAVDAAKEPFSVRDLYYYSYQEYLLAIKRAGAEAYFVTDNASYLGGGKFERAWTIKKVSEVADFQVVGPVTVDVLFNKGGFESTDLPVVTDERLFPALGDKTGMYKRFGRFQPKSVVVQGDTELADALHQMPGELAVIKNPVSNGGRQVYIGKKAELKLPQGENFPLLVQEFVDMRDGLPGLAAGVHDVRVLITGGKIIGATLRVPPAGSLYANVSKGAAERLLSVEEIPAEVRAIVAQIDAQLEDLPRYYAADFAKGKQGWVLMELNMRPGLFRENTGPLARGFADALAEYLTGL